MPHTKLTKHPKEPKNTSPRLHPRVVQALEYMVSGGAYFWVGYLAFYVFDHIWSWNLFAASMVANLIGWTVNFILQRYWVFKNPHLRGHLGAVTGRYMVITVVDFFLNYGILAGLKSIGITPYIGQFVSAGFFTVWNYLWYRFWVFPEQHKLKLRPRRR